MLSGDLDLRSEALDGVEWRLSFRLLSARDALHAAVMEREAIHLMSSDSGFDRVPG
ncbi:MAG: PIN domain-containing protein [Gammaproteobacteria bacterium]